MKILRAQVEQNSRRLKVGNDKLEKDDILAGLTAVLTVRIPEPQFEGQTKEVLGTPAIRGIVSHVVTKAMAERFSSPKRGDKTQATLLLDKIVAEMKSRISARTHKETQRRKNALENSSLPAKLVDCRSNDVANSELFIVEGDSALGTAKLARDSEYQALLPIRGKILNVQKASVSDMLSNAECASIIQVIGAGSGRSFDLELGAVRQGHHHERRGCRRRPHPHAAAHAVLQVHAGHDQRRQGVRRGAAAAPGGRGRTPGTKPNDAIYTYSEAELEGILAGLKKANRRYQDPIQRYKGLGEMDADQLASTTMDRRYRTLRRVRVRDAELAARTFELLMGNDVAPRKDFIVAGSDALSRDRIDM